MQTFLPYPSFGDSIHALDPKRLGRQILEAAQILRALREGPVSDCKECGGLCCVASYPMNTDARQHDRHANHWCEGCEDGTHPTPWHNHPTTQAWRGHEAGLASYGLHCLAEYRKRGGNMDGYRAQADTFAAPCAPPSMPSWHYHDAFHAGHRGHLHRKAPTLYPQFLADAAAPLLYPATRDDGSLVGFAERIEGGKRSRFRGPNGVVASTVAGCFTSLTT